MQAPKGIQQHNKSKNKHQQNTVQVPHRYINRITLPASVTNHHFQIFIKWFNSIRNSHDPINRKVYDTLSDKLAYDHWYKYHFGKYQNTNQNNYQNLNNHNIQLNTNNKVNKNNYNKHNKPYNQNNQNNQNNQYNKNNQNNQNNQNRQNNQIPNLITICMQNKDQNNKNPQNNIFAQANNNQVKYNPFLANGSNVPINTQTTIQNVNPNVQIISIAPEKGQKSLWDLININNKNQNNNVEEANQRNNNLENDKSDNAMIIQQQNVNPQQKNWFPENYHFDAPHISKNPFQSLLGIPLNDNTQNYTNCLTACYYQNIIQKVIRNQEKKNRFRNLGSNSTPNNFISKPNTTRNSNLSYIHNNIKPPPNYYTNLFQNDELENFFEDKTTLYPIKINYIKRIEKQPEYKTLSETISHNWKKIPPKIPIQNPRNQLPTCQNYQLHPSIQTLHRLTINQLKNVNNFKVQNKFGSVKFLVPINLLNTNIDEMICIEQNNIEINNQKNYENPGQQLILTFRNFGYFTNLHRIKLVNPDLYEIRVKKYARQVNQWISSYKMTFYKFDEETGTLVVKI